MQRLLFLSMTFLVAITGCKKSVVNPATNPDRQIRFSLPGDIVYDTKYRLTDDQVNIHKFNIDYYSDLDSVFYTFYSSGDDGNTGTVELYNVTDSIQIAGSLINVVANGDVIFHQSANLKAAFPHKEITIGLRLKGTMEGSSLNAVNGNLYLYRK